VIRLFVVDDSAFVRRALDRLLEAQADIEMVGEAANGIEALEKIPAANPDVVTLDVAMPLMDGLRVLRALLRWKPGLKVLMVSALTSRGAEVTVEALASGAVDVIDKSSFNLMDLDTMRREVVEKIRACGGSPAPLNGAEPSLLSSAPPEMAALASCQLCVIGASTGGPAALQRIVERLQPGFPFPVVLVQHMPAGFTEPFAKRLDALSRLRVAEAVDGERLAPGMVRVAPAGLHLRFTSRLSTALSSQPVDAKHIPSIDYAMQSAAHVRPGRVLGILLTGMGQDGAEGMVAIRATGGPTIAESEASCVVYGMPRAARARGGVTWMLPLPEIAAFLHRLTAESLAASAERR
jgi:two-component system chemotaxis response regulator CheB